LAQSSLIGLYSGIWSDDINISPVHHPGLFDPIMHMHLCSSALARSKIEFPNLISMPTFPGCTESPVVEVLLGAVSNVQVDLVPQGFIIEDQRLGGGDWSVASEILSSWVKDSLNILSSFKAVSSGEFDTKELIRIIRALWFVYGRDPKSSDEHGLYKRALSTFSALSIHRYAATIIKPLVDCLGKELGKQQEHLKIITDVMKEIIEIWLDICCSELPMLLSVGYNKT
jgi:hypothetical protein